MQRTIKSFYPNDNYINNKINNNKYLTIKINDSDHKIYYNGILILTNKYKNFLNNDFLYVSNYKNDYENGISYKGLYKNIKSKEDLSDKVIVLRDPPPTNKLLRNLKCKFIIILTNKIKLEYFRIIMNGFLKIDQIIDKVYDDLVRKDILSNLTNIDIQCETYYNDKFCIDNCPICFDKKKLYYTNCGHCLCNSCFLKIAQINNKCPICRTSFESKNKNIFIRDFIKKYKNENHLIVSSKISNNQCNSIKSIDKFKNKYLDKTKYNNIIFDRKIEYNYIESLIDDNIKSRIISFV